MSRDITTPSRTVFERDQFPLSLTVHPAVGIQPWRIITPDRSRNVKLIAINNTFWKLRACNGYMEVCHGAMASSVGRRPHNLIDVRRVSLA